MHRSIFVMLGLVGALFLCVGTVLGAESDELRARARAAKKEAAELAKAGRGEEAEKHARKATELLEAAERLERERPKGPKPADGEQGREERPLARFRELMEKERRMRESGASEKDLKEIREQIAKAKAEFGRARGERPFGGPRGPGAFGPPMWGFGAGFGTPGSSAPGFGPPGLTPPGHGFRPGFGPPPGAFHGPGPFGPPRPETAAKADEAGRNIRHLRAAAMHLGAAGLEDMARQAAEKAEYLEREAKTRLAKEAAKRPGPMMDPGAGPAAEMRKDIDRLRAELGELDRRVKELERDKK